MTRRWILVVTAVGLVTLGFTTGVVPGRGLDDGAGPDLARAPGARDGALAPAARGDWTLAAGRASRPEDGGPLPPPVDLDAVDRDLDLHGVVVDGDGRPIAGASLAAVTYPFRRAHLLAHDRYGQARPGPATRSADDGTFALRLRPAAEVSLRVRAAGFAPVELLARRAGERLRVTLRPGVAVRVTVVDPDARPIDGVALKLFARAPATVELDAHATTGPDGVAVLADLPPSVRTHLESSHPSWGDVPWTTVDLPERGEVSTRLVLPRGRTLTGRVFDAGTGAGIAGARVGAGDGRMRGVTTDVEGRYALAGWTGALDPTLEVAAEGYGRATVDVGKEDVHDVALERGDVLVGRATDAGGRPVRGAVVGVVGRVSPDSARTSRGDAQTGEDGRFRVTSLRRDVAHAVVVMAEGLGRTVVDVDPRPGGPGTIDVGDVVLPAARRLAGRVRRDGGAPVPDAVVTLSGANADRGRLRAGRALGGEACGNEEETRTDDLGRFGFPDLAPGVYALRTQVPGAPPVETEVVVGPTDDVLDVDLRVADGRPFRIVVVDDAGAPVPWAWVHVVDDAGNGRGVTLDRDGTARLLLPDGDHQLVVSTYPHLAADARTFLEDRAVFPVDPRDDEARCVLVRAARIAGRVVGPDGEPGANLVLVAIGADPAAEPRRVITGDGGEFELRVRADGPVELRLVGIRAYPLASTGLAGRRTGVQPGARDVVVRATPVTRTGTQEVLVLDEDGRPVAGARVHGSFEADRVSEVVPTDVAGRAVLTGLPDLPTAWLAGPPTDRPELLPTGGGAPASYPGEGAVVVRMRRGLRIVGRVTVPEGVPLDTVRVALVRTDGDGDVTWTVEVDAAHGGFAVHLDPDDWPEGATFVVATAGPEGGPATHRSARVAAPRDGTPVVLGLQPVER